MDGCGGISHPNGATSGPLRPEMTDSKAKGKDMKKKAKEEKAANCFLHLGSGFLKLITPKTLFLFDWDLNFIIFYLINIVHI